MKTIKITILFLFGLMMINSTLIANEDDKLLLPGGEFKIAGTNDPVNYSGNSLVIISFKKELSDIEIDELTDGNIRLVQYLGNNSFYAMIQNTLSPATRSGIRAIRKPGFAEKANIYLKETIPHLPDSQTVDVLIDCLAGRSYQDVLNELETIGKLEDFNIILFTASSVSDKEINEFLEKGVKGIIRKPIEVDELEKQISKLIS